MPEKDCYSFFYCNVSSKNLLSLFLCFKKSDALYLFSTNWLLLLIIDKFTITEFAILIRNLSFLVPPSTLGEHIYRVSVILRKGIFQISPGWLPPLLLFWFTYLYHRYSGEAFSHSLKEAKEDRRKRGKKQEKRYDSCMQWAFCLMVRKRKFVSCRNLNKTAKVFSGFNRGSLFSSFCKRSFRKIY